MACIASLGFSCLPIYYAPQSTNQTQRPLSCASTHSLRVPSERYEFISHIQEGSTAHVSLAKDRVSQQHVALKKISHVKVGDLAPWQKEIAMQQAVQQHPNIAKAYALDYDAMMNVVTIVQEYCPNGDLIDRVVPDVGMDHRQASKYVMQVADALSHMHALGYVHRDVKSENVCLDENDNCKLIDFGMSQHVSQPITHRHAGTTPYLSAEIFNTSILAQDLDLKACDVWSLGIMLFSMMTGRFAWRKASLDSKEFCRFVFNTPSEKQAAEWARIPAELQSLLRGMLRVKVSERLTMQQVYDSLSEIVSSSETARGA